ncbi:MAG: dihydrofolate reductase [Gammaproteobacteria bacterium]|nr:dihydrofolate reductase [Gammaproteobacteria bacterium]
MTIISMIAACGENGELGKNNALLWHLPADMKHFRQTTMGKPIIVGRKTFESFGGKALPGRKNIVVTRDENYRLDDALVVHSLDAAIKTAGAVEEIVICGGAELYALSMDRVDRIYLTIVHQNFDVDAWFPVIDDFCWQCIDSKHMFRDEKNSYDMEFMIYENK